MRSWLAAWSLALIVCAAPARAAEAPAIPAQALDPQLAEPTPSLLISGALDPRFQAFDLHERAGRGGPFWLRLQPAARFQPAEGAALVVEKGRHFHIDIFAARAGRAVVLPKAAELAGFAGTHAAVFVMPDGLRPEEPLYARVEPIGTGAAVLRFSSGVLPDVLATGANHERVIALSFGALLAMSLAALLMWFLLADRLFLLYGALFALNSLYVVYLSGVGFDWPVLRLALPLGSDAWNVPAALAGATAALFIREIADLKRYSPRVYTVFGWFALVFVLLAAANGLKHWGLTSVVTSVGNLIFIASAIFTLIVAARSWARGNRAAGWFLIAWGLLEGFTIATAARLLFSDTEHLLYYGLPASMVAAAILVALGVADRLREQRAALTDAERRAQTDPLTGVLNRRSLIERLEAACLRARARGLPIALLFIDLDHFKQINDTFGHLAGDACLAAIIEPIQAELRQSDVVGRYGGEEFVVILSSADAAAAYPIAERILERVANVTVPGFGEPIRLTCSIGVAASDTLGVWDEHLIARADEAVYAAKRSGRNRVQVAQRLAA